MGKSQLSTPRLYLGNHLNSINHQTCIVESWPPLAQWQGHCANESDTQALAQHLANSPVLGQGLLTLHGDLGAGKTTFVRHLLRALGVPGRIKSPTYAVVEPHQAPPSALFAQGLRVSHFDFYRFSDPREWEDAGFRELFADPGLKLVEWPEKAQGLLPTPDLSLTLTPQEDESRQVTLLAHTPQGQLWLQALQP